MLSALATYGRMIKFSHSIFALPFAFSGAALAATRAPLSWEQVGWIVVAMVGARSAAMGFNRLVDRDIDAANPRTSGRELPQGVVAPAAVVVFIAGSAAALFVAAYQLNPLCFYLAPAVLAVLCFYSLTKRFTWASHLVLGLSLGGAPLGAWIAIAGSFDLPPIVLGGAVLCWVAGFDILYACQDFDFDRGAGLHSIPVRFGLVGALNFARAFHLVAVLALGWVGILMELQMLYWIGIGVVALLLLWEHRLVKPDDLTKVNMAFMTMNSLVSVVFFGFTLADLLFLGNRLEQLGH